MSNPSTQQETWTPYAFQVWVCASARCTQSGGQGCIVADQYSVDVDMRCEVCGTGYDARGQYVPEEDDD